MLCQDLHSEFCPTSEAFLEPAGDSTVSGFWCDELEVSMNTGTEVFNECFCSYRLEGDRIIDDLVVEDPKDVLDDTSKHVKVNHHAIELGFTVFEPNL